jgi:formyltetrahydrofolate deformylase
MKNKTHPTATLLITCPDQRGIIAAVSGFIFRHHGNVLHSDQHQDAENGLFLMRVEWELQGFSLNETEFKVAFAEVAEKFRMSWRISYSNRPPRMAILVSKMDHCLADLLYRYRCGELPCEIPLVLSNHPDTEDTVQFYGLPFHHLSAPVERSEQAREGLEKKQLELLREHQVDLVVLARYMQILTPLFVRAYPSKIINIHHSFLPAFIGQKPYHRAYERGVKLIGATSHYVTEGLDEGPIIEQDVIRISHRDSVEELIQKGRDLERVVLSRAVKWHLDDRIVNYGPRTVIFD